MTAEGVIPQGLGTQTSSRLSTLSSRVPRKVTVPEEPPPPLPPPPRHKVHLALLAISQSVPAMAHASRNQTQKTASSRRCSHVHVFRRLDTTKHSDAHPGESNRKKHIPGTKCREIVAQGL
eukprot:1706468-Rhodomonas_salina.1